MIKSSKPRLQRLFRAKASLHERQKFVVSHIDKALITKLNLKRKSVRVVKGDTVKLMVGNKKGKTGKVLRVDLKSSKIFVDTFARKNARGKEKQLPIAPGNVYITDLNLEDKVRAEKLHLSQVKKVKSDDSKKEIKEPKEEKKIEEVKPAIKTEVN